MLWRSIHRIAPRLERRSQTTRQSVGAGREARSGAITRQGSARQPFWAAWPPSARPAVSVGPLFTPCSSNPAPREPFFSESMLVQARTALLDPGARDEFQQVPGVAQAMPWIPGTGNRPAVPLDPLAGTHSAAGKKAEQNAEQPVGHASDMRSGTLVIPPASAAKKDPSRLTKRLPQGTGLLPSAQRPPTSCSRTCVHEQPVGYASDTRSGTLIQGAYSCSLLFKYWMAICSPIASPWSPSERKWTPAKLRPRAALEASLFSSPTMVRSPLSAPS